jgi:hypothetical protein
MRGMREEAAMKMLEKIGEGAGIAANYAVGVGAIWFGAVSILISLLIWGLGGGIGPYSGAFFVLFGAAPVGGGIWMFRRGKIQQQLFKVKLLKEAVRKLAFKKQGRLRPAELAEAQSYSEERALHILKSLAAEDPDRVELQLDYESGELYFEFPEIIRAIEAKKEYQALPTSKTLDNKAVEIARTLGKTVETFYDYVEYARQVSADQRKQEKIAQYKQKIERFVREIETLKNK